MTEITKCLIGAAYFTVRKNVCLNLDGRAYNHKEHCEAILQARKSLAQDGYSTIEQDKILTRVIKTAARIECKWYSDRDMINGKNLKAYYWWIAWGE